MPEVFLHEELKKTKKELNQADLTFKNSSSVLLLAETNEVRETEALRVMGLVPEIENQVEKKGRQIVRKNLEENYDTLFSGEEIKKLCMKYGLRFLPTKYYLGPIKEDFGAKIIEFNEAHSVSSSMSEHEARNYKILAPYEAFGDNSKKRKSKISMDPILFYQVDDMNRGTSSNEDHLREKYYTIVYEWGNKFNIWRMITSYKRKNTESSLVHTFFVSFAITMIALGLLGFNSLYGAVGLGVGVGLITGVIRMAALTGSNKDFGKNLISRSWSE